ncbi:DMT family transporter [Levilactobacillus bambusae]|uniref:Peptide ABC transporter ATP-binding protein n=1 Tax=Levilactobacillus bambusae TaxID=2024736 RepID=A0A2V1MZ95_9LACO|nr:EamA family transporter [Levilactobacillus bambusae]PWG00334.1 peptide ABC transporter ATP-binding protein [Levilactobacillus bambusae]
MQTHSRGIWLAVIGTTLWGVSGTVAQALFDHFAVNTSWMIVARMLTAGGLILLLGALQEGRHLFDIWRDSHDAWLLLAFSIFGMLGVQSTYFFAIQAGNSATATVLQFLNPTLIIIVMAIYQRIWPRRVDTLSVIMATVGTFLVVTSGHLNTLSVPLMAVFWGLLSAIGAMLYTILPVRLIKVYGAIPVVGWSMLIGGIIFNCYHPIWRSVPAAQPLTWGLIAFVIIGGTLLGYLLYLASLRDITPTTAGVIDACEPLSATILSVLFLNVHLTSAAIVGTLLIISTVFVQAWGTQRTATK